MLWWEKGNAVMSAESNKPHPLSLWYFTALQNLLKKSPPNGFVFQKNQRSMMTTYADVGIPWEDCWWLELLASFFCWSWFVLRRTKISLKMLLSWTTDDWENTLLVYSFQANVPVRTSGTCSLHPLTTNIPLLQLWNPPGSTRLATHLPVQTRELKTQNEQVILTLSSTGFADSDACTCRTDVCAHTHIHTHTHSQPQWTFDSVSVDIDHISKTKSHQTVSPHVVVTWILKNKEILFKWPVVWDESVSWLFSGFSNRNAGKVFLSFFCCVQLSVVKNHQHANLRFCEVGLQHRKWTWETRKRDVWNSSFFFIFHSSQKWNGTSALDWAPNGDFSLRWPPVQCFTMTVRVDGPVQLPPPHKICSILFVDLLLTTPSVTITARGTTRSVRVTCCIVCLFCQWTINSSSIKNSSLLPLSKLFSICWRKSLNYVVFAALSSEFFMCCHGEIALRLSLHTCLLRRRATKTVRKT